MSVETISVVGLGYIGLPTAAVAAGSGLKVIGVDVNSDAVVTINQGKIHIVEPDLEDLVKKVVDSGRLVARTKPEKADAFLIAVPTPFKGKNHEPDLSYIESAAKGVAAVLEKGNIVILESTSPVGATEQMSRWMAEERPDLTFPHQVEESVGSDILVAHCPERVLPGQVIRELVENDRIIGGLNDQSTRAASSVYKLFVTKGHCVETNARTAEMSKLTENAFRDVNIAFANELSLICDKQGIDVWELIALANRHPRVDILQPGCGVGGHCISVDPWFIVNQNPDTARLIHTSRKTNDFKPLFVSEQIEKAAAEFDTPCIACLGLAFKPDIDDLRESPALAIVLNLVEKGYRVLAVEPNVASLPAALASHPNVRLVSKADACNQAHVIVCLVKHKAFFDIRELVSGNRKLLDFVNL
ncbi:UDP-N-acetyl-D-mannosamine dehydrogenase [Desulfoluna spongiiphila]|uniref:UDP-N-acetyl-D-mannosamine dehydrogenase n=1 Tax=Desulfoluna spongiiphila TaxID=419481 RepID=UPI001255F3D7|nr:UDP-N-acetyl-D-mannosamine dehydrogenase [Desulfoluna spongiiphila]VVS92360.1 udp-n-acetyl-d-mannosamine/glucosamine dehydrogenase [Desulfoluna spongiiphila]